MFCSCGEPGRIGSTRVLAPATTDTSLPRGRRRTWDGMTWVCVWPMESGESMSVMQRGGADRVRWERGVAMANKTLWAPTY